MSEEFSINRDEIESSRSRSPQGEVYYSTKYCFKQTWAEIDKSSNFSKGVITPNFMQNFLILNFT